MICGDFCVQFGLSECVSIMCGCCLVAGLRNVASDCELDHCCIV